MFAVYSPQGLRFSGPLEQLRRVEKLSQNATARHTLDSAAEDNAFDNVSNNINSNVSVDANSLVSKKASDSYRAMLGEQGQPEPVYHAYQIMSKPVLMLRSDWQLHKVGQQFKSFPYQVFPVVNEYRQLRGSLSRQEYYEFITAEDFSEKFFFSRLADSFLKSNQETYAVDPITDVRRISQLFVEKNLNAIPVVKDSGEVIGIVSRTDILRCATSDPPLSLWC